MVNPFALSLFFVLTSISAAEAKDFGTQGIIFPIAEDDPIALIQNKLKAMEETGELSHHEKKLQRKTQAAVERPPAIKEIVKATESRIFYHDPSYVVAQDLRDHKGKMFAKKGTKINPFDTVNLTYSLIFFDGDDEEQLEWVKAKLQEQKAKVKLILIKGAPLDVSASLKRPVYFDQGGVLVQKLGIHHVPAEMSQEGNKLRIEEYLLKNEHACGGDVSLEERLS